MEITYDELMERIRKNMDHCELIEYLELDVDDLIMLLGGKIWEKRSNFYFLEDEKYREL